MAIEQLGARIIGRWKEAWARALVASFAAILAWKLAETLFGHQQPLFAAITALVCLSPGLPSRGRQAVGMLLGVSIGILVGELALQLPAFSLLLRMAIASFFAVVIATSFGWPPVVPIQAGVSSILVIALGPGAGGQVRMLDVLIGAGIGLFVSQILMSPDPVRTIEDAVRNFSRQLASGFGACRQAVADRDMAQASSALQMLSMAHDSLVGLRTGIQSARGIVRWTLRGRLLAGKAIDTAALYDRHSIRLYAAALLFADALTDALRQSSAPPPRNLEDRIAAVEETCMRMADTGGSEVAIRPFASLPDSDEQIAPGWQTCVTYLRAVEDALNALGGRV